MVKVVATEETPEDNDGMEIGQVLVDLEDGTSVGRRGGRQRMLCDARRRCGRQWLRSGARRI